VDDEDDSAAAVVVFGLTRGEEKKVKIGDGIIIYL
jgi:hypothetical protein